MSPGCGSEFFTLVTELIKACFTVKQLIPQVDGWWVFKDLKNSFPVENFYFSCKISNENLKT